MVVAISNQPVTGDVGTTERERIGALQWLETCRFTAEIGLSVRMSDYCADCLQNRPPGDLGTYSALGASAVEAFQEITDVWTKIVGGTPGNRALYFPLTHVCILRGPVKRLREFLESPIVESAESPVVGLLCGHALMTPEAARDATLARTLLEGDFRKTIERYGDECYDMGRRQTSRESVYALASGMSLPSGAMSELMRLMRRWSGLQLDEDEVDDFPSGSEFDYLESLGIGSARSWGESPGLGQTVCIIDSGADESHPMLQRQVKHYVRFDTYGHEKEAYACMDHACHGSKIAGWICGRPVSSADLDLDFDSRIRLGIAPGAKAVVVSALSGDLMAETATLSQLFAGLEYAFDSSVTNGHEIVNISIEGLESMTSEGYRTWDRMLQTMKRCGLVPILAAGNRGPLSRPLGTQGCYVGVFDQNGVPSSDNGPNVTLLAPGKNLFCAHPRVPRLNGTLIGRFSGSSLSAAIVSGAVALVAAAKRVSASRALEAIEATARDKKINIDDALRSL